MGTVNALGCTCCCNIYCNIYIYLLLQHIHSFHVYLAAVCMYAFMYISQQIYGHCKCARPYLLLQAIIFRVLSCISRRKESEYSFLSWICDDTAMCRRRGDYYYALLYCESYSLLLVPARYIRLMESEYSFLLWICDTAV